MRPARWMFSALVTVALAHPTAVRGQQGAGSAVADLRIRATGPKATVATSGVLPFDRQGLNEVLAVAAIDAAGKPVSVERFAPRWTTSDSTVVSLYSNPTGSTMRVVAQQPGRATVTVTVLGKSATIPVIVGKARETIAAAELTQQFRVARLELTPSKSGAGDADAALTGRALLMRQNGHALYLNAKAFASDGTPIPLDEFPVTWTTGNASVAELLQPTQKSVLVVGREHGRTTVTATIQGVSVAVDTYIGDRRADVDPALLAAPAQSIVTPTSSPAAPVAPAAGAPPTAGAPPAAGAPTATTTRPGTAPTAAGMPRRAGAPAGGTTLAAPSNVRTSYVTGGMTAVRWNPVRGATGYVLLVRSPGGAWAGGNQLTVGNAGVADTVAFTRQLAEGTYELSATAVAEGGMVSSPQASPVSITVPRWSGRYRVTINGIRVIRETVDDPAETDGKRDEVFLRAHVGEFTAADLASGTGSAVQSRVHGDVNAAEWQGANSATRRVKAGSASTLGGLKTGDVFPASWASTPSNAGADALPLLVWEGDMHQGQGALMITPTIWESDQRPGVPATWTSAGITFDRDAFAQIGPTLALRLRSDIARSTATSQAALDAIATASGTLFPGTVLARTEPWALAAAIRDSVLNPTIVGEAIVLSIDSLDAWLEARAGMMRAASSALTDAVRERASRTASAVSQLLSGTSQVVGTALNVRDRPIGVGTGTSTVRPYKFAPQTLLLTFENVEARLAAGVGMDGTPPGFVAVRYTDGITGLGGNGDYIIYLQIHRVR